MDFNPESIMLRKILDVLNLLVRESMDLVFHSSFCFLFVKILNNEYEGKNKSEIDINTYSMQKTVHEITGKPYISKACGFLKLALEFHSHNFNCPFDNFTDM